MCIDIYVHVVIIKDIKLLVYGRSSFSLFIHPEYSLLIHIKTKYFILEKYAGSHKKKKQHKEILNGK